MAKPRVFVCSTYYDLKHVRERLKDFIADLGYEPVLFENGDIPFRSDAPLDVSCYNEVDACHMLVLIVGGRWGSPASGQGPLTDPERYNSVSGQEYATAAARGIPIFIFVDNNVLTEYGTFQRNRDNRKIEYAHVDSVEVFHFLDQIYSQPRNNPVRGFSRLDDILSWLRQQWAGLFAHALIRTRDQREIASITTQIAELQFVTERLKTYSEAILHDTLGDRADQVISEEDARVTISRFGNHKLMKHIEGRADSKGFSMKGAFDSAGEHESFPAFLKALPLPQTDVKRLLDSGQAQYDFRVIRAEFFGAEMPDPPISDLGLPPDIEAILEREGIKTTAQLEARGLTDLPGLDQAGASKLSAAVARARYRHL